MYRTSKGRSFAVRQKRRRGYRRRLAFQAEFLQYPSSPYWHQPRKATNQTFMVPQVVRRLEKCMIISLPKYKRCMSLKRWRTAFFRPWWKVLPIWYALVLSAYSVCDSEHTELWPCRFRLHQSRWSGIQPASSIRCILTNYSYWCDFQVTLEIDTNRHKGQDRDNKFGNDQGEQSKASANKEDKPAETFQLPVELLD